MQTTSVADAKLRLEESNFSTITLPISQITLKYRKPDLIESSLAGDLPSFLSEMILLQMRSMNVQEAKKELETKAATFSINDVEIQELIDKSSKLLTILSVEPRFSFDDNDETVNVENLLDVDRLFFISKLMEDIKLSDVKGGGTVSEDELATFPRKKRSK